MESVWAKKAWASRAHRLGKIKVNVAVTHVTERYDPDVVDQPLADGVARDKTLRP